MCHNLCVFQSISNVPIIYGWKEEAGKPHYFINDHTNTTAHEATQLDFKKLSKAEAVALLEKIFAEEKTTAIHCDRPVRSAEHPTMKPIKLCAELIYNSSREGALVYEPFCGSGSTLLAAEQLNRKCYAIEIDAIYCDATVKRYIAEAGEAGVVLVRGGTEKKYSEIV